MYAEVVTWLLVIAVPLSAIIAVTIGARRGLSFNEALVVGLVAAAVTLAAAAVWPVTLLAGVAYAVLLGVYRAVRPRPVPPRDSAELHAEQEIDRLLDHSIPPDDAS